MPEDTPAATPVLEMRGIGKDYYGSTVLHDVDLVVRRGEIHALLGENGAGKSTLMNVLFGMPVIHATGGSRGEILLNGKPVRFGAPVEAMAAGVGMVHQEFMLLPGFTVAENIKLNREPGKDTFVGRWTGGRLDLLDRPRMAADADRSMERTGLSLDEGTPIGGLPVGHMQFVEIARELDKEDLKILVFDEPTAVLTESEAERLLGVMRKLAAEGIAILFITHRLGEVMSVADTVTILRDGERASVKPVGQTSIEEIAATMVGREIEAPVAPAPRRGDADTHDVILRATDLRVAMPGEEVRGIDLELRRGEILGIGGLAGQGKLGIANGLVGLHPARGTVEVEGERLKLGDPRAALRAGLAFVSEDRRGVGLLLDEPLDLNVAIPAMQVRKRFLRGLRFGPLALLDRRAVRERALEAIETLDIRTTGPDQPVRRLSGGNQQKVCLARAMLLEPRILLVSEPTRGIDVGAKALVLEQLVRLNVEHGLTIVMTSSELLELRSICHRIAIVAEGRLAGILAPDDEDVRFGLLMSGEAVA